MPPADWLPWLGEVADSADAIALRLFRTGNLRVEAKPDLSPVSDADRGIEAMARTRAASKSLGVLGEEEGESGPGGRRLIIDPIDATRNFVRGIPIFATLLAIEEEGEIVAGLVSAPALGARWWAARGGGAWSGARRLTVSSVGDLGLAQVFHGDLGGRDEPPPPAAMAGLLARVQRARGFGDFYQHTLVAEGAGELGVDPEVKPWDVAALQVIVEEAGGRATTLGGARSVYGGSLVTSNGRLHDECLGILGGEDKMGGVGR